MYPSREQVALLMKHIHACRFVYNHSLEQKIRAYEQEGRKLSCFDLNNRLPALKPAFSVTHNVFKNFSFHHP